jgi:hypothetical protein
VKAARADLVGMSRPDPAAGRKVGQGAGKRAVKVDRAEARVDRKAAPAKEDRVADKVGRKVAPAANVSRAEEVEEVSRAEQVEEVRRADQAAKRGST